jgi:predicted Zn-dependent protease
MKRKTAVGRPFLTLGGLLLPLLIAACSTVAVTGRRQLDLIPSSTMLSMSSEQYGEFLKSNRLSDNRQQTELVRSVGNRIRGAVERYFAAERMSDQLNGYTWDFNLIEDPQANAWCMPGGKVVVYTGLLPITQTETGLAVVMGHEIAHAVAEHGNERMSQQLVAQFGGMALSEALSSKPQETRQAWMTAFGLGAQVGALLPFSRLQETEADRLGLIFMAMAGYDPRESVRLWKRMGETRTGQPPPEILSTHPSDATRIRNLEKAMPEALRYYSGPS